jgi:hypothetical protein
MRRGACYATLIAAACSSDQPRIGMCNVEHLDVTWPATIQRGGVTTSEQLEATLAPTSVTPEVFDSLATTLVHGRAMAPAVLWSVPAFNVNPGGIVVVHRGALRRGEVVPIRGVMEGGGWAVMPKATDDGVGALVGVEAGEFVASEAWGTLAVLETEPLALRVDVTARDSLGDSVRVRGEAQFSVRRQRRRCDEVAE